MTVTCIVFTLLLSNTDVDTAIPWVNTVVHQLMPLVIVVDWLLDPPVARLTIRQVCCGSAIRWFALLPSLWGMLPARERAERRQPGNSITNKTTSEIRLFGRPPAA